MQKTPFIMRRYITIGALASVVALFDMCAVNPVTGKKQLVLMSEAQEVAMGKDADPSIIQEYGLYENKELQDFINQKGKAMGAVSHRPNLEYNFRIVDSEILNAFAIPGGYVYFTRGIMAHFNNEAQFAGVLGHEIGHVTARHSVIQQRNATLGQVGLIAGMIVAPQLGDFAQTASQGLGLLFLKFGRDDERQSDDLGVEYSSKIGYDAEQMASFFTTLERSTAQHGGNSLPAFLSTHPNPADRNVTVAQRAKEWKTKLDLKNAQINRNVYLKKLEGLVYGADPRQGFIENNVFYHPQLKFQFGIPTEWATQNSPSKFQMASKDGKAMMILSMAPGKTLQEASAAMLKQYNLTVVESKETTVNSLPALAIVADQKQEQASLRTLSYLIQYDGNIYHLIGVSSSTDFNNNVNQFTNTMQSFKKLTEAAKLNKKPERVRIKTLTQSTTLEQAFRNYNMPAKRFEELAILNGMYLKDVVEKGTMIKVVGE
jgi:predicted Zn-dependent protease